MYYYSTFTGTIFTIRDDQHYVKPITNHIYNIIIKEAIELDVHTIAMGRDQTLRVIKSGLDIYFLEDTIMIYNQQNKRITIPYTEYIGLKELTEKYAT